MNKPKEIIICCGIPCSGKNTWANSKNKITTKIISRDIIRESISKKYIFSLENENKVTKLFNNQLSFVTRFNSEYETIILDNTFCKEEYIDNIIKEYGNKHFIIKIKYFNISLWKAHYRNVIRYLKTGKWIPVSVINNMKKSYDKINRKKYEQF